MGSTGILGKKARIDVARLNCVINVRQFNLDADPQGLLPLSIEQQCIMNLGEWEQYCTDVLDHIPRANQIMSWNYVPDGCTMRPFDPEAVIAAMVNDGGWAIVGDSLAREVPSFHFFNKD